MGPPLACLHRDSCYVFAPCVGARPRLLRNSSTAVRKIEKRPSGNKSGVTCFKKVTNHDDDDRVGVCRLGVECGMCFYLFSVDRNVSIPPAFRYDGIIAGGRDLHFSDNFYLSHAPIVLH